MIQLGQVGNQGANRQRRRCSGLRVRAKEAEMLESEKLYREMEALRERLSLLSQASRRIN